MWPWEHVLFAYVAYSFFRHFTAGRPPEGPPTIALVAGSLFPDVIDKPLAWEFAIFSSGYAIAHSIFIAVPLSITIVILAYRRNRPHLGIGFAFGYLLHLIGDIIPIAIRAGELYVAHLLWPVVETQELASHGSFRAGVQYHLASYTAEIISLDPSISLLIQGGIVGCGFLLWIRDGRPGLRVSFRTVQRLVDTRVDRRA